MTGRGERAWGEGGSPEQCREGQEAGSAASQARLRLASTFRERHKGSHSPFTSGRRGKELSVEEKPKAWAFIRHPPYAMTFPGFWLTPHVTGRGECGILLFKEAGLEPRIICIQITHYFHKTSLLLGASAGTCEKQTGLPGDSEWEKGRRTLRSQHMAMGKLPPFCSQF